MRIDAIEQAKRQKDAAGRINVLREYLQACTLRSLHESRAFECLSFVGGTALRFLYDLPRYSEDLDFSLEISEGYKPREWLEKLDRDLRYQGFDLDMVWNDRKTVHTAWIRFPALLMDAGIIARPEQKLSIKLEIDTKPPTGAVTLTKLVNRYVLFSVRHHDLPSLMAGKVHALLTRPYVKGRDWYDLVWYRSRRPPIEPNAVLLAAALDQTATIAGDAAIESTVHWRHLVAKRASGLDFQKVSADVSPFLEHPSDAALLSPENIADLLS